MAIITNTPRARGRWPRTFLTLAKSCLACWTRLESEDMTCSITSNISQDDLRSGVEQVLSRHFRSRQRLKSIRRRRSAYSSSYALENLKVELESGRKLRLVLKDLSPCS